MKKSLLIIPLLLAGCAKVSDYQASCDNAIQSLAIWLIALMPV
ncbi:hypothetical protein P2S17_23295 [Escherichia coli]